MSMLAKFSFRSIHYPCMSSDQPGQVKKKKKKKKPEKKTKNLSPNTLSSRFGFVGKVEEPAFSRSRSLS